jgi:hypothetical protein
MSDPLDMDEIVASFPLLQKFYDEAPHVLHSVIDATNFRSIPANILRARTSPVLTHPNSGMLAGVDGNGLAAMLVEIMFRLINYKKAKFFTTREEGVQWLRQIIKESA